MRAAGLLFILLLRSEPLTSANEPPADARFLLIRDPWTDPPDTVRLISDTVINPRSLSKRCWIVLERFISRNIEAIALKTFMTE
ncbi:hypothetical protein ROHU_028962 [Labeo rohita]|uniref:Uncharacterized protein n=1 Tax=Labeo rohita TaxID=84645 RepID=A0A498LYT3_LABRO|nr:hypothetical protein ROHU_028962 [Labeo rohita]